MNTAGLSYGTHVLVLNASYEPLHRVSLKHAIKMLVREVAVIEEAHETEDGQSVTIGRFQVPRVLRLVRYVVTSWKYRSQLACTKEGIKRRDKRCAYCGARPETVDHIHPRSRGGLLTWDNAVAACLSCNNRKADRTPAEAGMALLFEPRMPAFLSR